MERNVFRTLIFSCVVWSNSRYLKSEFHCNRNQGKGDENRMHCDLHPVAYQISKSLSLSIITKDESKLKNRAMGRNELQ
jgi:hypothetical protein